jgi:D-apionolactonase
MRGPDMTTPDLNRLLHGDDAALPEQKPLSAGPLTLIFEAGDLRYIALGRRELVRRIYGAVRDRHWGTVPGRLTDLVLWTGNDQFRVSYTSEHREGDVDFAWRADLEGRPDGTITFGFAGEARSTFARNRIGLCVLHPMHECAGLAATVRRSDGTQVEARFPELVASEQPVEELSGFGSVTYEAARDVRVQIAFEGEVFETEDQRNWIDASFKTYGTPLSLPRPVTIAKGTRVEQRVTVRLRGVEKASSGAAVRTSTPRGPDHGDDRMPAIGLGADGIDPHAAGTMELLRALHPAHLRVELPLDSSEWETSLARATEAQRLTDCALEIALAVGAASGPALESLAIRLGNGVRVARILVFAADAPTTTPEVLALVREHLRRAGSASYPIGAGSRRDLYEFHLHPPPATDLVCWSINPHVHASDLTSIAETPPAAAQQVRTMRRRHPEASAIVTPVTLAPRPRLSAPPPADVHPLHRSLFGAAWTLAIAAHLARAGAASVTFFERLRELGLLQRGVFPLYHVVADVCECAGGTVLAGDDDEANTATLLVRRDSGAVWLAANLSRDRRIVRVPENFMAASMRVLDRETAVRAAADPLGFRTARCPAAGARAIELGPFATARADGEVATRR